MRGGVKLGPTASKATTPQHSGQACKCSVRWCQTPVDPLKLGGSLKPFCPHCNHTAMLSPAVSILLDIWGGGEGKSSPQIMQCKSQALGTQPCSPADRADHTKAGHVHSQQNPCCCFFLTDTFSVLPACPLLCLVKNKIKNVPKFACRLAVPTHGFNSGSFETSRSICAKANVCNREPLAAHREQLLGCLSSHCSGETPGPSNTQSSSSPTTHRSPRKGDLSMVTPTVALQQWQTQRWEESGQEGHRLQGITPQHASCRTTMAPPAAARPPAKHIAAVPRVGAAGGQGLHGLAEWYQISLRLTWSRRAFPHLIQQAGKRKGWATKRSHDER